MTVTKKPLKRIPRKATLQTVLKEIAELKSEIATLEADMRAKQTRLMADMQKAEVENLETTDDEGHVITGVIVQATTVITDEGALAKRLGAQVWNKITTRVLDKTKLADAIKNDVVSEVDVAAASTIKPKAPYIKVTRK